MLKNRFSLLMFGAWMALAGMVSACSVDQEAACATCGTVAEVSSREQDGKASGAGAIAGAVIGGVVGSQIGGGSGKDAATAAGAIGGGYAGHEAEKKHNAEVVYDIRVDLATGGTRTITVNAPMGLAAGDKVRLDGNRILRGWS